MGPRRASQGGAGAQPPQADRPPNGREDLVAEAAEHRRGHARDLSERLRVARQTPRDGEHRVLPEDLERRAVEGPGPLLARDEQRPQHGAPGRLELARAAQAAVSLGIEHPLARHHRGDPIELAPRLVRRAPRVELGREEIAQREQEVRVERGVGELRPAERPLAPVRALERLGEPDAEVRLDERREPEPLPAEPARGDHRVEQARQAPAVLTLQAADVVVGAVQDRLPAVAEHLTERARIHRQWIEDVVGGPRRDLQEADPLAVDVKAVRLCVERHHRLRSDRLHQLRQRGGVGDEERGGARCGRRRHPAGL